MKYPTEAEQAELLEQDPTAERRAAVYHVEEYWTEWVMNWEGGGDSLEIDEAGEFCVAALEKISECGTPMFVFDVAGDAEWAGYVLGNERGAYASVGGSLCEDGARRVRR